MSSNPRLQMLDAVIGGIGRRAGPRHPWARWLHNHRAIIVLIALLLLIVASPVEDYWRHSDLLVAPTAALIVLAEVRHGSGGGPSFYATAALAVAWIVSLVSLDVFHTGAVAPSIIMLALSALVMTGMARQILSARSPDWGTLSAALSGYLLIAIAWAQVYALVFSVDRTAFATAISPTIRPDALLYLSLQTITTLGYGDIPPVDPFVRMLAVTEAIVGQFYIATVIARLVALASARVRSD